MLVSFDQMADTSRVWIYQADRKLTVEEESFVERTSAAFAEQWAAHGNQLKASFFIAHNQFLILSVDEGSAQASGCSIDSSVHLIKAIEDKLGLSMTNNGNVAFLIEDEVTLVPFNEVKNQVVSKKILPETRVFDNTVKNLGEFQSKWLVESGKTWISRFFN